ncbi:trypsin-1 [Leptinotarsa decemlineata]|uniref:trypsin-1 n=1 Tax=Leptinotarsa decemlineata TaxID=7539 RepID=UPI003D30CD73
MMFQHPLIYISVLFTTICSGTDHFEIYGGKDAVLGQFPFEVSIQLCDWFTCEHNCGGSIVAPNWIVTAGHCYSNYAKYKVVAGIVSLKDHNENRQELDVIGHILHEQYRGKAHPNDIALFEVNTSFVFNEWVQPVVLPESHSEITGEGVVSGWGISSGRLFPHSPDILQYENAPIIDNINCMEKLNKILKVSGNTFNVSANICSDNVEENYGICFGDSGGPLVYENKLVGISSWGILPCASKKAPSVYTKVSYYSDWIKNHIASLN